MRYANVHALISPDMKLGIVGIKERLFKKKHTSRACESRHEALRSLKNEIPA
jgi:hypothetical protein